MRAKYFLSILFICFIVSIFGHEPQYSFLNYNTKDGIPSSEVYDGLQDKNGYLWFSTDRGIVVYNGYEFKSYTAQDGLTDNVVFELFEDEIGRIWIIPMNGKLCYFQNGKIHKYKYNSILETHLNKFNVFNSFYADKWDNIYIGTYGKGVIYISANGILQTITKKIPYHAFIFSKIKDHLFASRIGDPLSLINEKLDTVSLSFIFENKELSNSWKNPIRTKIYSIGHHYAIYNECHKVVLFDQRNSEIIDEINFDERIATLEVTGDEVFVGIQKGGGYLFEFTNDGLMLKQHILKSYSCTGYIRDKEGGYWILTEQHGIFYIPNFNIPSYTTKNGLSKNYIKGIGLVNEKLVVAYHNAIMPLDSVNLPTPLNKKVFTVDYDRLKLHPDYNECMHLVKKSQGIPMVELMNDTVYAFNKVVGYKIINNEMTRIDLKMQLSRIEDVEIISQDNYWVGGANGLFKITPEGVVDMSTVSPLFSNRVTDISQTRNYGLVVATSEIGLIFLNDSSITTLSAKNGLNTDYISSIYLDHEDILWACTNKGLYEINPGSSKMINHYTMNDGLISNEITDVRRLKNKVYVGTKWGISIIDLTLNHKDTSQVEMRISSLKINNSPIDFSPTIHINPGDRNFEIQYVGLKYSALGNIEYRYRIKELSHHWYVTKNRVLRLEVFPDNGIYTIEIQGRQYPNGNWSNKEITFRLQFHPPFYKSTWFKIGFTFFIILLVYLSFKVGILNYNRHIQQELVNRLLKLLSSKKYLIIEVNKVEIRIDENDILFVQSSKDYVEINTHQKKYLYRCTLKQMEEKLSSMNFIRVHRSFIVHKNRIDSISKHKLTIQKHIIPIGLTYQSAVKILKKEFSRLNI